MITIAFGHGKSTKLLADGYRADNYLTSFSLPVSVEVHETTVFNSSDHKSYTVGTVDATISGEGYLDSGPGSIDALIKAALGSSTIIWTYYPQGDTLWSWGHGVRTIETSAEVSTPTDGVTAVSMEGQQDKGGSERVFSYRALASASTSGNGSSRANGASTKGAVGYLQRTDTGTKTLTAAIQHSSSASGVYTALVSFTASTGRGAQRVPVSGTVKAYTRAQWTLSTGGTGSPVFQVSCRIRALNG